MPKNPKPRGTRAATATRGGAPASTPVAGKAAGARAAAKTAPKPATKPAKGTAAAAALPSERRDHLVTLSAELFAEKGFRATTVREIADAAGILSGSLYHHFSSKESIADEILSRFLDEVLTDYRAALASGGTPREVLEEIARTGFSSLERHRAAIMMLQNDWNYFREHSQFDYLQKTLAEVERIWIGELKRGREGRLVPRRPRSEAHLPAVPGHDLGRGALVPARRAAGHPPARRPVQPRSSSKAWPAR